MSLFRQAKVIEPDEPRRDPPREDPTGLAPLVARLREWTDRSRCFPSLERDRASIELLLEQIAARQASLETPLRILMLGGTGVGKSTVFNALAGADLAEASSKRPTTSALTAYFHVENGSGALGELESRAKLVSHARPLLRDKIVSDAPDFDSTAPENRELLVRALESTDLALCVATSEKYLSHELFKLLAAHREGVEFVFVLNKLDRTQDWSLIADDWRAHLAKYGITNARILRVSALTVRTAQREAAERGRPALDAALPEEAGQWAELRALLEKELDRVRIRQIKAAKLADRVRGALARVEEHVPSDVPEKVEAWRRAWSATMRDLSRDLSRTFFGAIHDDFELRNILRYLFGTAFGGAFGVFMTLVYGLRSVLMPGFVRARRFTSPDLEALLGERLRAVEISAIEGRVAVVLERFEQEGRRLGLEPDGVKPRAASAAPAPHEGGKDGQRPRTARLVAAAAQTSSPAPVAPAPQGPGEGVAALVVAVRAEAARRFYEIFEETVGGGQRGARAGTLVWNVLPLIVVISTVWAFLTGFVPGETEGGVARALKETIPLLEGALVSLLFACILQWPIAERVIERRIQTSLSLLEGVVDRSVEACLGHVLVKEPERVLAEVLERHREFERLRDDAKRVLREDTSRTLKRPPELALAGSAAPPPPGDDLRSSGERPRERA